MSRGNSSRTGLGHQMNPGEMDRVFDAFDRLRVAPPAEHEDLLALESGLGPEMIQEVRSLLEHDSPTTEFMGGSPSAATAMLARHAQLAAMPESIGPYRIVRVLGQGGFGTVFLAEELHPRRLVALKVMRPMYSPSEVRRMEFEAESLARLSHPGIARVYATGIAAEMGGCPYIAMEYVKGEPIDVYARRRVLSVRRAIELMVLLCDAVAHAHLNGVIHRDLAPKNILVDASERPKVLDFGLATRADRGASASLALTAEGQFVGTLRYMSPEGLSPRAERADTRADVYALGVVAFEMLTGKHPYLRSESTIGEIAMDLANGPVARAAMLNRELRGDVDAVLAKAVERDPICRYQSVAEFAEDLKAVLDERPVRAKPASAWYLLRTFARRHRAMTVTIGFAFAIIAASLVALSAMYSRATVERSRAISSSNAACAVLRELADALSASDDPADAFLTARAWLGAYNVILAADGERHPEAPKVAWNGAIKFEQAGELEQAARLYKTAHDEYLRRSGPQSGEARATLWGLGRVHLAIGRTEEARGSLTELIALLREQPSSAQVMSDVWEASAAAHERLGGHDAASALRAESKRRTASESVQYSTK